MNLRNKVTIITGAGQGIGSVLAHKFAEAGARVVVAAYDGKTGDKVSSEIADLGYEACCIETDISDELSVQKMVDETIERYGVIDILVNNAGASSKSFGHAPFTQPFEQISMDEWDYVMAVNLRGLWLCCKAVVPYMKAQKRGKIINTSSSSWDTGRPFGLSYVTSKAGIVGFTRGLASELGDDNINVNCVSYGPVLTDEREDFTPEVQEVILDQQSIKKMVLPEDLAGTVKFLASEDSDLLTGQTIYPDRGFYFH